METKQVFYQGIKVLGPGELMINVPRPLALDSVTSDRGTQRLAEIITASRSLGCLACSYFCSDFFETRGTVNQLQCQGLTTPWGSAGTHLPAEITTTQNAVQYINSLNPKPTCVAKIPAIT